MKRANTRRREDGASEEEYLKERRGRFELYTGLELFRAEKLVDAGRGREKRRRV